jgi:Rrf2 family transcriptional regulator, nitric oxide-sensitive transcriptional repressor
MISQTAEYALRAAVYLAQDPDQPHTVEAIASATKVPEGYLAKIMLALAKAGLVTSQRGIRGGFMLQRNPQQVTVRDVVHAIDPIQRITSCPLNLEEHGKELCPLHRCLDSAIAGVDSLFRGTTLVSLITPGRGVCGSHMRAQPIPPA